MQKYALGLILAQIALSSYPSAAQLTTPGSGETAFNPADQSVGVVPVSPYQWYQNGQNFYYAGGTSGSLLGRIDEAAGFRFIDFASSITTDSASRQNAVLFDVMSNLSPTEFSGAGNEVFVAVFAEIGSDHRPVPIALAGGALGTGAPSVCNDATCGLILIEDTTHHNRARYFGARFSPGQTLRIGIYPSDLCYGTSVVEGGAGTLVEGCEDQAGVSVPIAPTSGTTTVFRLRFAIGSFSAANPDPNVPSPPGSGTSPTPEEMRPVVESGQATAVSHTIRTSFQISAPSFSCIDPIYFPGDGEVLVNPGAFSAKVSSGFAPIDRMMLVAREGGSPETGADFATNDIVARIEFEGGEVGVPGFKNSTTEETVEYGLAVNFRNAAGIMQDSFESCGFDQGVMTASIRGFLADSNCFIATAAFRSGDAAPVMMLREFRDRILASSTIGRRFIDVYYRHGPRPAEWLMDHESFRSPVLRALAPIQVLAWVMLNPAQGLLLAAAFLLMFSCGLMLARRRILGTGATR